MLRHILSSSIKGQLRTASEKESGKKTYLSASYACGHCVVHFILRFSRRWRICHGSILAVGHEVLGEERRKVVVYKCARPGLMNFVIPHGLALKSQRVGLIVVAVH